MKTRWIKGLALLLAVVMLVGAMVGCSSPDPLLTLDGQSLSVNLYEFMLSIQKGNMAYMINYWYGDPNSEEFWDTVIDENSTTWDDYYTLAVYKKAKNLLAANALFDELGLSLDDATVKDIDDAIDSLIENDAGSKKALNTILGQYGVNVDMYREYKMMEAKSQAVADHLYGKGGSKIGAALKEQYLQENYVAFQQIFIANYYYEYVTDKNGDIVYYTSTGAIAYDTEKGTAKLDEDGKFGYFTEDGRVAYDTEGGKPSPVLDEKGEQKIGFYSKEQMAERAELAMTLADQASGSVAVFEGLREKYSDEGAIEGELDDNCCYLATNVDYASVDMAFMDQIGEALEALDVGEVTVVPTDYGYHVVRRYETEAGAYADKALSQWFSDSVYGVFDFVTNLENDLFIKRLAPYAERIVCDEELLESVSLKSVEPNYYYR